ncbi:MAG: B12-binding domain-containing radical SAM protein [Promethearchaeota archaeon]
MARVLLLRPYFHSPESMPIYPLGLAYLAASLRDSGHKATILDLAALKIKNKDIMRLVNKIKPDLIGITALSYYYPEMIDLCKHIKNYQIALGGVHVTALPELSIKQTGADYIITGEGEKTLVELTDYVEKGGDLAKIKGLIYKKNGKIIVNEKRAPIENLDEIAFPAWDLLNLDLYNPPAIREFNMFFDPNLASPLITTRGCPYKCAYCASTNFWGPSIRFRSIENVIAEIEFDMKHFNVKCFEIWDDNFTINRKRVIQFCKEVIRKKLDVSFYLPNGVRIDTLDRSLIKIMKYAGFRGLVLAPESGSQKILNNVNKDLDLSIVRDVAKMLQEERILTSAYFILGLPGENINTALETIKFGSSLPLNGITYFIFTPLPGSKLFEDWSKNKNLEEVDWKFDYFEYHNPKKNTMCDLSFNQLKKFQKLGYFYFLAKPGNLKRFIKRLNPKNFKIFLYTEFRNFLFLFFKGMR